MLFTLYLKEDVDEAGNVKQEVLDEAGVPFDRRREGKERHEVALGMRRRVRRRVRRGRKVRKGRRMRRGRRMSLLVVVVVVVGMTMLIDDRSSNSLVLGWAGIGWD